MTKSSFACFLGHFMVPPVFDCYPLSVQTNFSLIPDRLESKQRQNNGTDSLWTDGNFMQKSSYVIEKWIRGGYD